MIPTAENDTRTEKRRQRDLNTALRCECGRWKPIRADAKVDPFWALIIGYLTGGAVGTLLGGYLLWRMVL